MIFETHAHYKDSRFDEDRDEVIASLKEYGVGTVINVGDTLKSSARCIELAKKYDFFHAAVGVHPESAAEVLEEPDYIGILRQQAQTEPEVLAIGEIGLDYYWEKDEEKRKLQRKMFACQLALARDLDLPVCIHDREAHGDLMTILKTEGRKNRGVIHCFSGSWEMAKELLKLGWYIGVDGPLTYKNAAKLPEIVQKMPADRLLVETDCPYLSPLPYRGKRNEPAYVRVTAECAAKIRGESLVNFAEQTTKNACEIYGLNF